MTDTVITSDVVEQLMNEKAQPRGALGHLQRVAIQLCVQQQTFTPKVDAPVCLVFCGDHGVTKRGPAEGPSAYPREVTELMHKTVTQGRAAVTVMCATLNVACSCIDVGIDSDRKSSTRIARGTNDMTEGPAMSIDDCNRAIQLGRDIAKEWIFDLNKNVICVGELGIGNTTAASALVAALTGVPPLEVCGRGTGLDDAGVLRKIEIVQKALTVNAESIQAGPLQILAALGGLEIAAMTGAMMEASNHHVPVLVDGFISGAAALCARRLSPESTEHAFYFSHKSEELGAGVLLEALGGIAPFHMNMRLGEGTGAVLCVPVLQCAARLVHDMAKLADVIQGTVTINPDIHVHTP